MNFPKKGRQTEHPEYEKQVSLFSLSFFTCSITIPLRHATFKGYLRNKLQQIVKDRKPGVRQPMGLQRVKHDLATEQQKQEANRL